MRRQRPIIGILVMTAGMLLMPEGPWLRELGSLLLIMLGFDLYRGTF